MKRWLTLSLTGTGETTQDAIRPDLQGVTGIHGCSVIASSGGECLVRVVRNRGPLDTLRGKAGVRHHGDEPLNATARAAVLAEAVRLGAGRDWQPEGYDVSEGT